MIVEALDTCNQLRTFFTSDSVLRALEIQVKYTKFIQHRKFFVQSSEEEKYVCFQTVHTQKYVDRY